MTELISTDMMYQNNHELLDAVAKLLAKWDTSPK